MKKYYLITFLIFILEISPGNAQNGVSVRGQVQYWNPNNQQYFTLPNAIIDLYFPTQTGYKFYMQTITNGYGLYFFFQVPPGAYMIQINRSKNYQIQVYYPNAQFLDIPILYY